MSDEHLLNALRWCEQFHSAAVRQAESFAATVTGEMATFFAEQSIGQMEEDGPSATVDLYDDLLDEAARRGLVTDA